jgi:hypothetical protein
VGGGGALREEGDAEADAGADKDVRGVGVPDGTLERRAKVSLNAASVVTLWLVGEGRGNTFEIGVMLPGAVSRSENCGGCRRLTGREEDARANRG